MMRTTVRLLLNNLLVKATLQQIAKIWEHKMTEKFEFEGLVAESGCTADELRTIFESNPVLYARAKVLLMNETYGIEVKWKRFWTDNMMNLKTNQN